MKEHQLDLEDKVQLTNQLREQIVLLERRSSLLTAEEEELRAVLEQTDHSRKMAEHELVEVAERANLLTAQVQTGRASFHHSALTDQKLLLLFCCLALPVRTVGLTAVCRACIAA